MNYGPFYVWKIRGSVVLAGNDPTNGEHGFYLSYLFTLKCNKTLSQLNDINGIQVLAKPKSGTKHFLKIKTQIYFFSKFNFGDNHVFYFYHTFVGKQEMKRKHQKTCPKCGKFHDNFLHHLFL